MRIATLEPIRSTDRWCQLSKTRQPLHTYRMADGTYAHVLVDGAWPPSYGLYLFAVSSTVDAPADEVFDGMWTLPEIIRTIQGAQ